MFAKRWTVSRDAENLCLVYEHLASLKSRVSLYANGSLVAETDWRWNLVPITLRAVLPQSGASVEATVGYARNGFTRVHQLLVDGHLVSGQPDVPDLWSEKYPRQGYLRTLVVKGGPPALGYTIFMFTVGTFSFKEPLWALLGSGLFWLGIGSTSWLFAKWAAADRQRTKGDGVGSGQ